MSIKENLQKARAAIIKDINGHDVANDLRDAAIEAITHGLQSDQGRSYMALFCDNKNELARLTVPSDNEEDYMPQMRAYTPADAVCFPVTNTGFAARLLGPGINLEPSPAAAADVSADTPEPSAIRNANLFMRLQQG